jgi:galactose mutarotase-like enzyme
VTYKDYNYLGLWAKPKANFVCIEPWLGLADVLETDQDLKTKEGIINLDPNKTFSAQYTIEIDSRHLV